MKPPARYQLALLLFMLLACCNANGQSRFSGLSDKTWQRARKNEHLFPYHATLDSNQRLSRLYTYYAGMMIDTFYLDPVNEPREITTEARHYFELAIRLDSTYMPPYIMRGNLSYQVDSDPVAAVAIYDILLSRLPHNYYARHNIGLIRMNAYDYTSALAQFLLADPKELKEEELSYFSMAQQYSDQANADEAYELYRRAALVKMDEVDLYDITGLCYQRMDSTDKAIEYYQRSANLDPATGNALYQLGRLYGQRKHDLDSCILLIQKALQSDKPPVMYYEDLAVAYGIKGNNAKAAEILNQAIARFPNSLQLYYNLATAYQLMGQKGKEKEIRKKADKLARAQGAPLVK